MMNECIVAQFLLRRGVVPRKWKRVCEWLGENGKVMKTLLFPFSAHSSARRTIAYFSQNCVRFGTEYC